MRPSNMLHNIVLLPRFQCFLLLVYRDKESRELCFWHVTEGKEFGEFYMECFAF